MNTIPDPIARYLFAAAGAAVAALSPALPYILICTGLVFLDCLSAFSLSRRAAKAHPDKRTESGGKFYSRHFGSVILTLIKTWLLLILAFLIQRHITPALPVDMVKIAAGAVCFWQIWSILENESSCNGAKWARILQRILVDKTERHLHIDLTDLKHPDENPKT